MIDDDPDDVELISDALSESGWPFDVDAVTEPMLARGLILSGTYDAFVIDWRLGAESGIDMVAELAAEASGPMIAITGRHDVSVDHAAQAAGAFDYLQKDSATPEILSRAIRYAVQAWRERQRFQAVFDQAPVGLFRTSPDGTFLDVNPALTSILGTDLKGRNACEFYVDPMDRVATISALGRGEELDDVEVEMRRDDGSRLWASIRDRGVYDEGELVELYGTVSDITDRRRRDEERHLHAMMLDDVRHPIGAIDMEGNVIYWNRHAEQQFGWTREEVLGRSMSTLKIFDDQHVLPAPSAYTDGSWEGELTGLRKDGSTFPTLVTNSLVNDTNGNPVGAIGTAIDLSAIREAEAHAATRQAMADSVLNSVGFPTAILDDAGVIVAINDSWNQFALDNGGDPTKVGVGVDYLEVCQRTDDPEAVMIVDGIRSVLERRKSAFSMEYGCDGPTEQRWFRIEVTHAEDPLGGAVVLHLDITAIRRASEQAQKLAESRIGLIASVSHELRTPLTAILGFASLYENIDPDDAIGFADTIRDQATDMSGIIDDLLVAARSEIGEVMIASQSVALDDVVAKTLDAIPNTGNKTIEGALTPVTAFADPLRTRQIVRNLITNAIRYGGSHVTITTSTDGNTARISVTDDGEGIPDERLEHIFSPFETAHPHVGQPDSLGLGLAVARTLARAMQGDLTYTRTPTGDTVFEVTLPTQIQGFTAR